jgi:amino acid transporter
MHPRWGSPVAALVTQAGIAAIFIFLGQGGTSVKGAYDVLVSSTVIITLVPFLFLFASALKLRGRAWIVVPAALIGLATTVIGIAFAGFPADDDPNKALAVTKVIGLTAIMLLGGAAIYMAGRRKASAA